MFNELTSRCNCSRHSFSLFSQRRDYDSPTRRNRWFLTKSMCNVGALWKEKSAFSRNALDSVKRDVSPWNSFLNASSEPRDRSLSPPREDGLSSRRCPRFSWKGIHSVIRGRISFHSFAHKSRLSGYKY